MLSSVSVCFRSSGRLRLYPLVDFDKLLWCFGWVWQMTNQNQEDSSAGRSSRKLQVCTPGSSLRACDRDKSGHFSLYSLPLWHSLFVFESRLCQPTQATSFSQRDHRTKKATKQCNVTTESVWKRVQGQGLMLRNLQLPSVQSGGGDVLSSPSSCHHQLAVQMTLDFTRNFVFICLQRKRFRADSRDVNLVLPSSQHRRTISLPSISQGSHILPLNF